MRKVFLDPRYYAYSTRRNIDRTFERGLDLLYAFLIEANKINRKKSRVLSVVILRIGAIIHFLHGNYDKTYNTQERAHDVWDTERKERLNELRESERLKREEEEKRKEEAKKKKEDMQKQIEEIQIETKKMRDRAGTYKNSLNIISEGERETCIKWEPSQLDGNDILLLESESEIDSDSLPDFSDM